MEISLIGLLKKAQDKYNQLSPETREQFNQGLAQGLNMANQGYNTAKTYLSDPNKRQDLDQNAAATVVLANNMWDQYKNRRPWRGGKTKRRGRKSRKH